MECPNGCGRMSSNSVYVEVGKYGVGVIVFICQECQHKEIVERSYD